MLFRSGQRNAPAHASSEPAHHDQGVALVQPAPLVLLYNATRAARSTAGMQDVPVTVNIPALVAELQPTETEIVPVTAPDGTVVSMLVVVLAVTTATVPLNITILLASTGSKLVPVIVTGVPIAPEVGVNEAIVIGRILVLRNTETVPTPLFDTARSGLPSPSMSPIETDQGDGPVAKSTLAE